MKLKYQVEITGGFFPKKKILKGYIDDGKLIESIKNDKTSFQKNQNIRDGLEYKFTMSSNNYNEQFKATEFDLTACLKKLIDIAENNNK